MTLALYPVPRKEENQEGAKLNTDPTGVIPAKRQHNCLTCNIVMQDKGDKIVFGGKWDCFVALSLCGLIYFSKRGKKQKRPTNQPNNYSGLIEFLPVFSPLHRLA